MGIKTWSVSQQAQSSATDEQYDHTGAAAAEL